MKVLVLTARFGMGHYRVAEAIKDDIESKDRDAQVEIIDFMSFAFPKVDKLIYRCYNALVFKNAKLYNLIGKLTGNSSSSPFKFIIAARINRLIKSCNADAIVAAFPWCTQYISAYKELSGKDTPMYTCITDIPAHSDWIADETNLYFVASQVTKDILISKGVEENKIVISGVPVRSEFKSIKTGNKNDNNKKKLLVMGGGLGLLPGGDLLLNRLASMKDVEVTLIAGNNKELYDRIKRTYPRFKTIGYTDKISDYMKASDAIVTKPGGVTLFEAITTQTPMYVVRPFLLQELGNAEFIENNGLGKIVWNEEDATPDDIEDFITDTKALDTMKKNMRKMCREYRKNDIMTVIESDMEEEAV